MKVSLTTRKRKPNLIRSTQKGRKRKRAPPPPPPPPQPEVEVDNTPISSIACLKNLDDLERFEESDDCFILGFDPSDSNKYNSASSDDSAAKNPNGDGDDLRVIAEKGQVACRDFPHSRHVCVKYPFKTTPHKSHCELCFCYICDSPAPCYLWTSHCDAENAGIWPYMRKMQKPVTVNTQQLTQV